MTDEEAANDNQEEQQSKPFDESRFEVKWTKKGQSKPAAAAEPSPAPTEDAASLRRELEQEQQRVRDLRDRWQRAAADLANLKRRTEQERGDLEKFSTMMLVQELLPVLDNFERAIATIPGNLAMLTWMQGVILIDRHLQAILERQGLGLIETRGKAFNPHEHEAIAEVETVEHAPGTIVREYQRGFTMHGRVIRPALVEVAKAPSAVDAPETDPSTAPSAVDDPASGPAREKEPGPTDEVEAEQIADDAQTENAGP